MKAAVAGDNGLEIRDVPAPRPKPNEILVRVGAAGLKRAELGMAAGHKHGSLGGAGAIVGLEWSGEVVELGAEVPADLKQGDRVMCAGSGGYAEYAVADWGRVGRIPANNMSFEQAATLPIALQTMHDALVTNGRLTAGEAVLIQGASTGVGLMGLQIAKQRGAALVIGSSTNAARRARLAEFGADLALDSSAPALPDAVLRVSGRNGAR